MHSHTVDDVLEPILQQFYSSPSTHSSSVLKVPSDSTVNAFFKFLISLYFPSHAVSDIFSLFDTFSHFRNLKKCVHRGVTIPEGQQHVSPAQSG